MPKYRKLPIEIEAKQFYGTINNTIEIKEWANGWGVEITDGVMLDEEHTKTLDIDTLEGVMAAQPGDWIIRGVNDEFYPCKPDIFEKTYEYIPLTK
jgi:hypothetical protein